MRVGIVGAGIFGLAAALELGRRGHQVVVCERGQIPCADGASNDVSKVIRRTNYPEDTYVELVERAARQWRQWHDQLSRAIYYRPGKLMVVRPFEQKSPAFASWERFGKVEDGVRLLSLGQAQQRYPQFDLRPGDTLLADDWTGYLRSAQALEDLAGLVQGAGVELRQQQPVLAIEEGGGGVRLSGADWQLSCDRVVVAAGAWLGRLVPQLAAGLRLTRQQMAFFAPATKTLFERDVFPVWTFLVDGQAWYGFPHLPEGFVKVADDLKTVEVTDPDMDRAASEEFVAAARRFVDQRIPALAGAPMVGARSCLYTNTPDNHFLIDWVPGTQRLLVAGGGSGHGFKFGASIGPVIADALEEKENPLGDLFRLGNRF